MIRLRLAGVASDYTDQRESRGAVGCPAPAATTHIWWTAAVSLVFVLHIN